MAWNQVHVAKKAVYIKNNFIHTSVPQLKTPFNIIGALITVIEELRVFKPDVIVGSSYGVMLLMLLMQRGEWKGPSVLLGQPMGKLFPSKLWLPSNSVSTIVHGKSDNISSYEDSENLYKTARPQNLVKILVLDDNHSLNLLVGEHHNNNKSHDYNLCDLIIDVHERYIALQPTNNEIALHNVSLIETLGIFFSLTFAFVYNAPSLLKLLYYIITSKGKTKSRSKL